VMRSARRPVYDTGARRQLPTPRRPVVHRPTRSERRRLGASRLDNPHPFLLSPHHPTTRTPAALLAHCDLHVVEAPAAQSCTDACAAEAMVCAPSALPGLNACAVLGSMGCTSCETARTQSLGRPARGPGGVCEVSPIRRLLACDGHGGGSWQRFCPCRAGGTDDDIVPI
jgi:hypothetical protein